MDARAVNDSLLSCWLYFTLHFKTCKKLFLFQGLDEAFLFSIH